MREGFKILSSLSHGTVYFKQNFYTSAPQLFVTVYSFMYYFQLLAVFAVNIPGSMWISSLYHSNNMDLPKFDIAYLGCVAMFVTAWVVVHVMAVVTWIIYYAEIERKCNFTPRERDRGVDFSSIHC